MQDVIYTTKEGKVLLDIDVAGSTEVTFSKQSLLLMVKAIEEYETKGVILTHLEAWDMYEEFWEDDYK